MKFTDILKKNRELGSQLISEKYTIAVISNITVFQLKDILEFSLRSRGLNAEILIGDYDSIVQDSSRFTNVKAVFIFWETINLIDGLQNKVYTMQPAEVDRIVGKTESEIDLVLKNLNKVPLVLINRFSAALTDSNVISDGPLKKICRLLNSFLEAKITPNGILVDLDSVLASVGLAGAMNIRQFQSSKALYSIDFFKAYAEAVRPVFMSATGRAKKVLILDCDNTIWSGILGEDGDTGIQMNPSTTKGKIFNEVQLIISGLQKKGGLVALCSKNNAADIDKILLNHPDMILHKEDFVIMKVNWQDKATNIREIARELNLGLDSFVFVDDADFEIGLVQMQIPEVTCIRVPENLSEYPSVMNKLRLEFFNLSMTKEDENKTAMYQEEQNRKEMGKKFNSIDEYLASLGLSLTVYWDKEISVSRAAQMTQKTNQFNLTTCRYNEVDIQGMLDDASNIIAAFEVSDHYGDYGVTGLIIIKRENESPENAVINSFLMSCRIIGRKIEYAFFDVVIFTLLDRGIKYLRAEYIATTKNSQVEQFYDNLGFELVSLNGADRQYKIDLEKYQPKNITFIDTPKTAKIK